MTPRLFFTMLWLSVFALAVSGCAERIKYVEVKIPVPVTCQTPMPVAPAYPTIYPDDGLFVRVQKQLIIDELKSAYLGQVAAWGLACNA